MILTSLLLLIQLPTVTIADVLHLDVPDHLQNDPGTPIPQGCNGPQIFAYGLAVVPLDPGVGTVWLSHVTNPVCSVGPDETSTIVLSEHKTRLKGK